MYPEVKLGPAVVEFRRFSVENFGYYIEQLPRVEIATKIVFMAMWCRSCHHK